LINYAPGTDWSEEPYPNPWPGEGSVVIGSGQPNEGGNIHLKGEWGSGIEGKIWLVDGVDFDAVNRMMIGWNPSALNTCLNTTYYQNHHYQHHNNILPFFFTFLTILLYP
jgi:hypothetical protein